MTMDSILIFSLGPVPTLLEHSIKCDPVRLGYNDTMAVLTKMAQGNPGKLNWGSSIVDPLKLLKLDSSSGARKQLAQKLDVNVGPVNSGEQNEAFYNAVFWELAENGGQVPGKLRGYTVGERDLFPKTFLKIDFRILSTSTKISLNCQRRIHQLLLIYADSHLNHCH
jgi:hypothetical protein